MKLLCDVLRGIWGTELFVYPANPDAGDEHYLPMSINGEKVFLSKSSAKELSDILLRFVDG